MPDLHTGRCLCGGVVYRIRGPLRDVLHCHCHRCRRTSGNFVAASAAPTDALSFDAATTLRWYAPDDDPGVEYGFCARCGSSLFWRSAAGGSGGTTSVFAGSLDDTSGLRTAAVWFADEVAEHVTPADDVPRLTSGELSSTEPRSAGPAPGGPDSDPDA